ncbi:hypothetical protein GCM10011390_34890 [Aureimonas endophytica]|uniref:YcaO domain-containing protein n=1 Tax=Aureimonas endophytica TaxID=2027858 RepID=A0A916ZTQ2_9HYPH|nr:YcaO-like family protein [Aureimonas endophytica]GGE12730.1 hypothetical protein GCM10011390_34890 [Aureimonas endophytica]
MTARDGKTLLDHLATDLSGDTAPIGPYHDRARPPAETLSAMRALLPDLGITRIGLLTGLDVIGIPVAFATRPNSHSLSVFQGKGLDIDAAMTSAAMEAFETAVAERQPADLVNESLASAQRSGSRLLDLERTARCVPEAIEPARAMPWIEGLDLASGERVRVPWWLAGLDHREPRPSGFEQSSDGLASGNTLVEATFHGLCELIERDAWTLMLLRSNEALAALRVDPRSLGDAVLDTLVDRIERAGFDLFLADMSSDLAVPAYAAVLVPRALPRACDVAWSQICGGYGCHPLPARAAIRAVTEAAQTRLTLIAGSRDDLTPRQYRPSGTGGSSLAETLALIGAPRRPACRAPFGGAGDTIQARLRAMVARLGAAGLGEVVVVPIARHASGAAVVRVLVPGLEVGLDGRNVQLGIRAARQIMKVAA